MVDVEKSWEMRAVGLNAGSFNSCAKDAANEDAANRSVSESCFIIYVLCGTSYEEHFLNEKPRKYFLCAMNHKVNIAVQVLPLGISKSDAYGIIDEAIRCIDQSGLKYLVCPFETVIEGTYEQVMQLVENLQQCCREAGAEELLINLKLQRNFTRDVMIEDKVGKYL